MGSATLFFCNLLIGQDEIGIGFDTGRYSKGRNRQEMEPKIMVADFSGYFLDAVHSLYFKNI
jgi:hypothetical protein